MFFPIKGTDLPEKDQIAGSWRIPEGNQSTLSVFNKWKETEGTTMAGEDTKRMQQSNRGID